MTLVPHLWIEAQVGDGWVRAWYVYDDVSPFPVSQLRYENTAVESGTLGFELYDSFASYEAGDVARLSGLRDVPPNTPLTTRTIVGLGMLMKPNPRNPDTMIPANWFMRTVSG